MPYIADRRLYVTEDDRVVEAGDPDARWLLCAAGSELSDAVAAKYGLIPSATIEAAAEPEVEAPPAEASGWEPEPATIEAAAEPEVKPKRSRKASE